MYVCVCNAINCRTVRQAVGEGARTVSAVFRSTGKAAQCGRCTATMRDMIAEAEMAAACIPAIAAE
jgi:bacterioferritin-associated ferredoxin